MLEVTTEFNTYEVDASFIESAHGELWLRKDNQVVAVFAAREWESVRVKK